MVQYVSKGVSVPFVLSVRIKRNAMPAEMCLKHHEPPTGDLSSIYIDYFVIGFQPLKFKLSHTSNIDDRLLRIKSCTLILSFADPGAAALSVFWTRESRPYRTIKASRELMYRLQLLR
jgi:hypothetical protein